MKRKNESFNITLLNVSYGKIKVWSKVADDRKPTKNNIGDRVWVAGYTSTKDTTLLEIHKKGAPQWPEFGGYAILENGKRRDLHKRSVRLHPQNFIKRRKRRKGK